MHPHMHLGSDGDAAHCHFVSNHLIVHTHVRHFNLLQCEDRLVPLHFIFSFEPSIVSTCRAPTFMKANINLNLMKLTPKLVQCCFFTSVISFPLSCHML